MPLWQIFHPPGTFEDSASKVAFANDITKMYTDLGLPAFYVVASFIPLAQADVLVGGRPSPDKPFVRIGITHIALRIPDAAASYRRTTFKIDKIWKLHVADKGYDWEYIMLPRLSADCGRSMG